MKKTLVIVVALVMLFTLFVGCAQESVVEPAETESAVEASEEAAGMPDGIVPGSYATIALNTDVVAQQWPSQVPPANWFYGYLYDTLFFYPNGDNDVVEGLLVKSWDVSEDQLTWVMEIEENVYFNNGNKLTAESIVNGLAFLEPHQRFVFQQIDSIEATGEYQVTFNLNSPMPELTRQFAVRHMGICDTTEFMEYVPGMTPDGSEALTQYPPVEFAAGAGSGPYYVEEFSQGDFLTFKANENYWTVKRMPKIETITYKIIMDVTTITAALQTGEIDYAPIDDYNTFEILSAVPELTIVEGNAANRSLYFNVDPARGNLFDNKNVRKALSMMVDMEQVNLAATGGYGFVIPNAINNAFTYEHNRVYDPEAGLALLEQEGIDPSEIVFTALCNGGTKAIYENVQSQFHQYGITLEFQVQDIPAVMTLGSKGEFDMWDEHGGMTQWDFISPIRQIYSETGNFHMVNDQQLNEEVIWPLVDQIAKSISYEAEKEKITDLLKVLDEEYLYIGNVQLKTWAVFSDRIGNPTVGKAQNYWRPWDSYIIE